MVLLPTLRQYSADGKSYFCCFLGFVLQLERKNVHRKTYGVTWLVFCGNVVSFQVLLGHDFILFLLL